MEVVATTHWTDFILDKPTNVGYPAGVYMAGSFTGTQAASPNGDTISMTAEASGLKAAAGARAVGIIPGVPAISDSDRVAQDVINATPGAGTGDVLVSLPSSCTGTSTCKFTATSLTKSFNTQITETVQHKCDTGAGDLPDASQDEDKHKHQEAQ